MNTQGNDTYTGNAVFDDGMQGGLVETGETIAGQQGGDALVNENAVPGHNEPPPTPEEMRKDFFKDVNKFGKESGVGSSALARLGLRCVRAAADGLISIEKPTKGGKDDATVIYEAYTASDSKHAEHTAGGSKANASKLRQLIALGCMTTCDGVEVASNTVRLREEMEGQELKPKALFAGLVDVARAQLEVDSALSDDAIKEALTKNHGGQDAGKGVEGGRQEDRRAGHRRERRQAEGPVAGGRPNSGTGLGLRREVRRGQQRQGAGQGDDRQGLHRGAGRRDGLRQEVSRAHSPPQRIPAGVTRRARGPKWVGYAGSSPVIAPKACSLIVKHRPACPIQPPNRRIVIRDG